MITLLDAFTEAELAQLLQRIAASGELGRSKNYRALLLFLIDCARQGRAPKEIEIAIDILGRSDDFDVATDSTVRVYIHQLRKKLDNYYSKHEAQASYRLVIPKGQYIAAAQAQEQLVSQHGAAAAGLASDTAVSQGSLLARFTFNSALLMAVVIALLANLAYMIVSNNPVAQPPSHAVANHPVWQEILHDEIPVTLVMGDYYIFGELNANGNIARMVREFDVNSRDDLENLQFAELQRAESYLDLDLTYMPEGSAFALAKIIPLLSSSGKTVKVAMMSDISMADIRSSHIVYIGYISALEKLSTMAFAASGLSVGRSYDELVNLDTVEFYTSDAGLPEQGQAFKDYGLFSTFRGSDETQVVLISGMRDAGLMHTAQAVASLSALETLQAQFVSNNQGRSGGLPQSYEVLYEVFGVDRLNFDSNLIYANTMNSDLIWSAALSSAGKPSPTSPD